MSNLDYDYQKYTKTNALFKKQSNDYYTHHTTKIPVEGKPMGEVTTAERLYGTSQEEEPCNPNNDSVEEILSYLSSSSKEKSSKQQNKPASQSSQVIDISRKKMELNMLLGNLKNVNPESSFDTE